MEIQVLVADAMPVIGEALSHFLRSQPDIGVSGPASTADEAAAEAGGATLALVGLEPAEGYRPIEIVRSLRARSPEMVIVTMSRENHPAALARALAVGANGFIHKRSNPIQFLDGVRHAARGETVMIGLGPHFRWPSESAVDTPAVLSERERQVLGLTAQGLTARQVGRELGLRERTITTHLSRIYRKLHVSGKLAAIEAATRLGLLTGPDDDLSPPASSSS